MRKIQLGCVLWLTLVPSIFSAEKISLLTPTDGAAAPKIAPTTPAEVTLKQIVDAGTGGMAVTIQHGKDKYPGVTITPEKAWDLSKFGYLEAHITNNSPQPLTLTLRVDNDGDWTKAPWNTETLKLSAEKSGTLRVVFGYSYGKPGYKLKTEAISKVLLFAGTSDLPQAFQIDSLEAGGAPGEKPAEDPRTISNKPKDGILIGAGVTLDEKQFSGKDVKGSIETLDGQQALKLTFGAGESTFSFKPVIGRWDLRDFLEVRVKLKNAGSTTVTPRVRLNSTHGPSDWISDPVMLAAGASRELVIPFMSASIWNGEKGKGTQFVSDKATELNVSIEKAEGERVLIVESARASAPEPNAPEWLGKRPPVEGKWKQTLDENFDTPTINSKVWDIYGENYWDKVSHFSKDNVIIGDGVVKLRFEKKRGHQNDDPKRPENDYQAGFLRTYDKWTQKYGYFEARMKLPKSPGLWPAFWMMPDRGAEGGERWKREDTSNGGMEFDIMEHLTHWGPYRYNIAMHWDGYQKNHKSTGSEQIYVQPDKDGYITTGLLWSPGLLVYYNNGKEVLRWASERVSNVPAYIMFTIPAGGWDNAPLEDAKLPDDFVVDYVKAWQLDGP